MNKFYVYEFYIIETNEVFYVGKGKDNRAFTGKRNKFCEDMKRTHNWNVRIVEDNLTEEEAFAKEKETIKYYKENTNFRLTNQTDGGEGASGFHQSEETKKYLSFKIKQMWSNPSFKEKIICKRNDKNSVYQSSEFKNKISEITKGALNGNYHNYWSNTQKEHLSQLKKEKGLHKGVKNPKSKKIMCIETGEIFDYIGLAMKKYGVKSETSFSIALKTFYKTSANLHWVELNKTNTTYFNDSHNRKIYLMKCLINNVHKKPIIRLEDEKIFTSTTNLSKYLNVSVGEINNKIVNQGNFIYNNYHYMLLKIYYSRLMQ